jgi:hypothetical protein
VSQFCQHPKCSIFHYLYQVDTNVSEEHTGSIFRAMKMEVVSPGPHGDTTHKTIIDFFTALRTSNLKFSPFTSLLGNINKIAFTFLLPV